jgi:hypothetical protein
MNEEHPLNILAEQIEKQDPNKVNKTGSAIPGKNTSTDKDKVYIQPIRTFESDVARVLGQNNTSKASMIIAEKKRRDEILKKNLNDINTNNVQNEQNQNNNQNSQKYVKPLVPLNKYAILRDETTSRVEPDRTIGPDQFIKKEEVVQDKVEEQQENPSYEKVQEQQDFTSPVIPIIKRPENIPPRNTFIPVPKKEPVIKKEQIPVPIPVPIQKIQQDPIQNIQEIPESERVMMNSGDYQNNKILKKVLLSIFGIIFLGGGLYGAYYFYSKSVIATPPPPPSAIKIPSILPNNSQVEIKFDSLTSKEIYNKIYSGLSKTSLKDNEIVEFIPSIKQGDNTIAIDSETFIKKTGIDMPNQLLRSLGSKIMLGGIKDNDEGNVLFIAFTTDFFQNTYAGMLSWEKGMPDELEDLMNYRGVIEEINNNASSTINNYFGIRGKFIDKQIKNRDIREFIHESGKSLFLYTFIDKNTLIITKTENALGKIVEKIEKQNYIR